MVLSNFQALSFNFPFFLLYFTKVRLTPWSKRSLIFSLALSLTGVPPNAFTAWLMPFWSTSLMTCGLSNQEVKWGFVTGSLTIWQAKEKPSMLLDETQTVPGRRLQLLKISPVVTWGKCFQKRVELADYCYVCIDPTEG